MRAAVEQINTHGSASFIARQLRAPGFQFHWHLHPEVELTLILRGQGRRLVGDGIAPFAAGDLVLLGKNLPHTWSSEPRRGEGLMRHEAVVVQFLEEAFGSEFFNLPEMRAIRRLLDDAARGLIFRGAPRKIAARQVAQLPRLQGAARLTALLQILSRLAAARPSDRLALATAGFATEVDLPGQRRIAPGQRRIADVCRWINENFAQPLSLPDAAARAHLSVSAFSRFFRNATAKTFIEYVNEVRVGNACQLLLDTDRDIAAIALASGFPNLSHFNRRFLRSKSLSPRAFRRAYAPAPPIRPLPNSPIQS